MQITLKDGSKLEAKEGATALEIAQQISSKLAIKALCAKVNGKVWDLTMPISEDSSLEILTFEEEDSSAFYTREDAPKVAGVLIVAQGASDSTIERKIQQAVMALFQIEAHKIKVMKMK